MSFFSSLAKFAKNAYGKVSAFRQEGIQAARDAEEAAMNAAIAKEQATKAAFDKWKGSSATTSKIKDWFTGMGHARDQYAKAKEGWTSKTSEKVKDAARKSYSQGRKESWKHLWDAGKIQAEKAGYAGKVASFEALQNLGTSQFSNSIKMGMLGGIAGAGVGAAKSMWDGNLQAEDGWGLTKSVLKGGMYGAGLGLLNAGLRGAAATKAADGRMYTALGTFAEKVVPWTESKAMMGAVGVASAVGAYGRLTHPVNDRVQRRF